MWLWPTCLKWKSKAIRLVSHVARHVHRIGYTRRWWGILKPVFGRAFLFPVELLGIGAGRGNKLKAPVTADRKFEDVVKAAQGAGVA